MKEKIEQPTDSQHPYAISRRRRAIAAATTTAVVIAGAGAFAATRGNDSTTSTRPDKASSSTTGPKLDQRPGAPYVCSVAGGDNIEVTIDRDTTLGEYAAQRSGELLARLDPSFDPSTVGQTAVGEACADAWVDAIAADSGLPTDAQRQGNPDEVLHAGQRITAPGPSFNNVKYGTE